MIYYVPLFYFILINFQLFGVNIIVNEMWPWKNVALINKYDLFGISVCLPDTYFRLFELMQKRQN